MSSPTRFCAGQRAIASRDSLLLCSPGATADGVTGIDDVTTYGISEGDVGCEASLS